MAEYNRYPRGYMRLIASSTIGSQSQETVINTMATDPEIDNLYKLYMGRSVNFDSWDYRSLVIRCCARLYGSFRSWLYLQLTGNNSIYDFNLEFLRDTINFIKTGKRDMSVGNWHELLLEHPEDQPGAANMQRSNSFELDKDIDFENVLGQWCSHRGGFEDMLCTTHVLFGVSKQPILPPV